MGMIRPFTLSDIEAKSLLATLDNIINIEQDHEYTWLASVQAGRVIINHLRDKLEVFIADTVKKPNAEAEIANEGYNTFGVFTENGKWRGYYFDAEGIRILVGKFVTKEAAQDDAKRKMLKAMKENT